MNENLCPQCQNELQWNGQYHCHQCEQDFKKVGFCPECTAELENYRRAAPQTTFAIRAMNSNPNLEYGLSFSALVNGRANLTVH